MNVNPLAAGATLLITIPSELGTANLVSVTCKGGSFNSNPIWAKSVNTLG